MFNPQSCACRCLSPIPRLHMVEAKTDSRVSSDVPQELTNCPPSPTYNKDKLSPIPCILLTLWPPSLCCGNRETGWGGCLRTDWPSCSCPLTQCYPLCENPSESCFSWWSFHCHNWVPGRSLLCRDWLRSACILWVPPVSASSPHPISTVGGIQHIDLG